LPKPPDENAQGQVSSPEEARPDPTKNDLKNSVAVFSKWLRWLRALPAVDLLKQTAYRLRKIPPQDGRLDRCLARWLKFPRPPEETSRDQAQSQGPDGSDSLDYDFMPAALEVFDRPPAPLSRAMLIFIVVFAATMITWASIGKMDIVVTAMGKVVPMGKVKVIQPLDTGIVRKIYVRDGQVVRAGEVLIELDSTESSADHRALNEELLAAEIEVARLTAQIRNQSHILPPREGLDEALINKHTRILNNALQAQHQKILTLESEINRGQADMAATASSVARLEDSLRLSKKLFSQKQRLAKSGIITRAELIQAEIDMVNARKSLQTERNRLKEAEALHQKAEENIKYTEAEYRHELLTLLSDAEKEQNRLAEQMVKIQNRQTNSLLKAPVDGIVQQLAINTVGGVVTAAQPLMVIVPIDGGLEIEANVLNKDIGFIEPGQPASVKIDAYPFTRHGDLTGSLEWIGQDAVLDNTMGPVYPIRVSVDSYELPNVVNGRKGYIAPGMTVTIDVTTGERRVIEFFLGPILRYKDQSLKER